MIHVKEDIITYFLLHFGRFSSEKMPLKTYLRNLINNRKCRLNGIWPSTHLPHNHQLRLTFADHVVYTAEQLPPKTDLRPDMTPVEDQSQIGSW